MFPEKLIREIEAQKTSSKVREKQLTHFEKINPKINTRKKNSIGRPEPQKQLVSFFLSFYSWVDFLSELWFFSWAFELFLGVYFVDDFFWCAFRFCSEAEVFWEPFFELLLGWAFPASFPVHFSVVFPNVLFCLDRVFALGDLALVFVIWGFSRV